MSTDYKPPTDEELEAWKDLKGIVFGFGSWQRRAEKAEAENARLREALKAALRQTFDWRELASRALEDQR